MKFLIDAQLPPALAAWIRSMGHQAEHVQDVALDTADDAAIRTYSIGNGAVLVTKDRDFVPLPDSGPPVLQIIWVRTGNTSKEVLLRRVSVAWPQIMSHLQDGAPLVELR